MCILGLMMLNKR
ncbi:rCG49647 [Rattus norvegicus]|uniref:RCG49647 n=1 Tax=Rattus norvegicus TaxID=10116 RepID=A6K2L3_RAT|nr:rCG49647 [Rattus norvegicus]